jgi:hypothetical protein
MMSQQTNMQSLDFKLSAEHHEEHAAMFLIRTALVWLTATGGAEHGGQRWLYLICDKHKDDGEQGAQHLACALKAYRYG